VQQAALPRATAITRSHVWDDVPFSWATARVIEGLALDGVRQTGHGEVIVNLMGGTRLRSPSVAEAEKNASGTVVDVRMEYATGTRNVRSPAWMRVRVDFRSTQMAAEVEGDDRTRVAGVFTLLGEAVGGTAPAKSPTPAPTPGHSGRRRPWSARRPWLSNTISEAVGMVLGTGLLGLVGITVGIIVGMIADFF
jgi:hypothetical protein